MSETFQAWNCSLRDHCIIEASAGTGKTTSLVELYRRLVVDQRMSPEKILVLTFTNAATDELRSRIFHALRDAKKDWERAAVFTIHGFCKHVLSRYPEQCRLLKPPTLVAFERELFCAAANEFLIRVCREEHPIFSRYLLRENITLEGLLQAHAKVETRAKTIYKHPSASLPLDQALAERNMALISCQRLWLKHRQELCEILLDAHALNRARYKRVSIENEWIPRLDNDIWASGDFLPSWIELLTHSAIESGTNKKYNPPQHVFFEEIEKLWRDEGRLLAALRARFARLVVDIFEELASSRKRKAIADHSFTYTGLIRHVLDCVTDESTNLVASLRKDFRAVLVDEYQDTDSLQHALLHKVFFSTDASAFIIGDPKQAIYGFRGAEVQAYIRAKEDFQNRVRFLDINWRASPAVAAALNHLYLSCPDPFLDDAIMFRRIETSPKAGTDEGSESGLEFLLVNRVEHGLDPESPLNQAWSLHALPSALAQYIDEAVFESEPSSIAVLCRTNAQAGAMFEAIQQRGLPVVRRDDHSIFDTDASFYLEKTFFALAHPDSTAHQRAATYTPLYESTDGHLNARDFSFADLTREWSANGFAAFIGTWSNRTRVEETLRTLADGEQILSDLNQLIQFLLLCQRPELNEPAAAYAWLRQLRLDPLSRATLDVELIQKQPIALPNAITVTTIHKAKGLEFSHVLLPYGWLPERQESADHFAFFHDPRNENVWTLDLGSPEFSQAARQSAHESEAEGMRLLYVALTRARSKISVVYGAFRNASQSPLGRLIDPQARDPKSSDQDIAKRLSELCAQAGSNISISWLPPAPA